jgi:hypothetical protein
MQSHVLCIPLYAEVWERTQGFHQILESIPNPKRLRDPALEAY